MAETPKNPANIEIHEKDPAILLSCFIAGNKVIKTLPNAFIIAKRG